MDLKCTLLLKDDMNNAGISSLGRARALG